MDPSTIQSLLVQQLSSNPGKPGTAGGGSAGPQMQGNTSAANLIAQLSQKALLMKALQSQAQAQQQRQATLGQAQLQPAMDAQTQALGQVTPQTMNSMDAQTQALMAQNPVMPPVLPQDQ